MRVSRISLLLFVQQFLFLNLWSFLSGFVVFKYNKAKIRSFSSLKDGSCLGLVKKDTETLSLVSVSSDILSQVKSQSRLVHKKMRQSCPGLVSGKKLSLTISRSPVS